MREIDVSFRGSRLPQTPPQRDRKRTIMAKLNAEIVRKEQLNISASAGESSCYWVEATIYFHSDGSFSFEAYTTPPEHQVQVCAEDITEAARRRVEKHAESIEGLREKIKKEQESLDQWKSVANSDLSGAPFLTVG
jgi:hypothetical protein